MDEKLQVCFWHLLWGQCELWTIPEGGIGEFIGNLHKKGPPESEKKPQKTLCSAGINWKDFSPEFLGWKAEGEGGRDSSRLGKSRSFSTMDWDIKAFLQWKSDYSTNGTQGSRSKAVEFLNHYQKNLKNWFKSNWATEGRRILPRLCWWWCWTIPEGEWKWVKNWANPCPKSSSKREITEVLPPEWVNK